MVQQRLPAIDGDDGSWGQILNQYLTKEHVDTGADNAGNGGHKNITITAGTTSLAPLTFTSGTNLTTAAGGSVEYDGTYYYLTSKPSATAFRRRVAVFDETGGATGDIYYRDSNGYLTKVAIGSSNNLLSVSGSAPAWNVSYATAPAASTIAQWDGNNNLSAEVFIPGYRTQVTSATPVTLTVNDVQTQAFTGSTAQTVNFPTGAGIVAGYQYTIINNSSAAVTVKASGGTTILILAAGTSALFTALIATPTLNTDWDSQYSAAQIASGTTMTFPAASDTVATLTAAQTLTNKVVQKRFTSITYNATPTTNTDNFDVIRISTVTGAITNMSTNLTDTNRYHGQGVLWEFVSDTSARAITWGTKFASSGTATLLATTVASKTHRVFTVFDSVTAKHVCMAVDATGY